MFSTVNYCGLQELCLQSERNDIPEAFMSAISAHGGLVHVILEVNYVFGEGIIVLIRNSPNLLTFYMYVKSIDGLDEEDLQNEFSNRKLFTTGGYKQMREGYYEYEQHTNLLSLWNYPFWDDVEVRSSSEDTDLLTIADFDKYPDSDLVKDCGLFW